MNTKRIYAVRVCIETVAMVQAESECEAIAIAEDEAHQILRDSPNDTVVDVVGEMRSQGQLMRHGWDEMCLPYGGDGNTRLSEILPTEES